MAESDRDEIVTFGERGVYSRAYHWAAEAMDHVEVECHVQAYKDLIVLEVSRFRLRDQNRPPSEELNFDTRKEFELFKQAFDRAWEIMQAESALELVS